MISPEEAIAICEDYFPEGLDYLVKYLSIRIDRSDIGNADGWCYHLPDGSRAIRLNSTATKERQRFTLAHELAHFVIGSRRRVMTLTLDVYHPRSREERDADELASRLLLPTRRVMEVIDGYAIDYPAIKELMNKGRVSDIVVALRLAKSEEEFGLDKPTVVWFEGGQMKSVLPLDRRVEPAAATSLFNAASASANRTARMKSDSSVYIASVLPNTNYPTLFLYRARAEEARSSPRRKGQQELERLLFAGDETFRRILNGCIGGNRPKLLPLDVTGRVDFVIESFLNRSDRSQEHIEKIQCQECYEWLYLRMESLS